jgi:iron(III) transport system substrate-binding protein
MRLRTRFVLVPALLVVAAACGGGGSGEADPTDGASGSDGGTRTLTVYSGREEEFVAPLFDRFEADTGIVLEVRYGDSAELAATISEEGDASPADVFFSQDAGSLGALAQEGLLSPVEDEILNRVDERFRSDDASWVGTSGRGRVAVYNTEMVEPDSLPTSIFGFTDPAWKGRLGLPPTNSSFQAHVAAMIESEGEAATRTFLEGLLANEVAFYEDNGATTRAVAAGEIEVGLVNHYYKYEVEAEDGALPLANHYFAKGDPGAFVNTAGVGILASSERPAEAEGFVDYVTGDAGQSFVAEETWEYPVAPGLEPSVDILPLQKFQGPDVDLSSLGSTMPDALALLAEVGMV